MIDSAATRADVVMLGSFGVWTRGTLQSRALPLARAVAQATGLRLAIVTTPWDAPDQAGMSENHEGVCIYNTSAVAQREMPLVVRQQLALIQRLDPALLHVMKPKAAAGMTADVLLRSRSQPLVVVDHDDWEGDGGWNDRAGYSVVARRMFAYQESRLLTAAHAVTTASTLLEVRARRLRPDRHRTVTFLPNGLDDAWLAQLRAPGREGIAPRLVLYSRFAEFSGGWLDAVLRRVDAQLASPLVIDVIGTPEHLAFDLPDYHWLRPIWHGFVPRQQIPELLERATIALYPYDDNLINRSKQSVKLLELMAAGCAVVATDVGDIRRIAGESAAVLPHGAPELFAGAVVRLLRDPDEARKLGAAARNRASRFTISRLAGTLAELYARSGLVQRA